MRSLFEQQQAAFEQQRQAFAENEERRAAEAARLLTTNQALTERIDQLLQLGQSEQDRRVQLEEELRQERARSAQAKPLVDSSKLGQKPPVVFGNTEAGWADWSWRFRNHMAAANQGARIAMKFAEAAGATPVSEEQVTSSGWAVLSDQLYSSLVGFTSDESSSIVRNTPEGHGLEAWRKLKERWHGSRTQGRVADKEALLQQEGVPDAQLGKALEDWEVLRTNYESKHATELPDEDAQIALLRLCSGDLRQHLNLHYEWEKETYAELRAYLVGYLERKRLPVPGRLAAGRGGSSGGGGSSGSGGSGGAGGAAPMDLSAAVRKEVAALRAANAELVAALGKGGGRGSPTPKPKPKPKAKAGGGRGAGGGGGGGATAQLQPWQPTEREKLLTCRHCNKPGHTERTCYALHPELQEAAKAHHKATRSAKRLAALTETPRDATGTAILAGLPRKLPAAQDQALLVAAANRGEREELEKLLEEERRALEDYLNGVTTLGSKEEEQALVDTLAKGTPATKTTLARATTTGGGTTAKEPKKKEERRREKRGVLFDTAAGASCVPLKEVEDRTPLPGVRGPELETASGEDVRSGGEMHDIPFHTGKQLLPARATAADVVQPILSAAEYCGPGGEFEATLRPTAPELRHTPTGAVFPLEWEDGTLKLAPAEGATEDAKLLKAKLAALLGRKARTGLVRSNPNQNGKKEEEKEKRTAKEQQTREAEKEKLRTAALEKAAELGSAAFRLSRAHLLALVRDSGARRTGGSSPTKKELFRLLTGELPAGAGRGLRPGKPGRELNAL